MRASPAETAFNRNCSEFERSGFAAFGWRDLADVLADDPDVFSFGAGDVDDKNSFWSWVGNLDAEAAAAFYDIVKSY